VDRSSDIFIATACGSIREVSGATGLISTILGAHQDPALAGGGGDHDPLGLAVGGDGKLIVTEAYGRRVLEIDPATHRVTLVAGTGSETLWTTAATAGDGGPAPSATFGLPLGVAADGQGNIFVADSFDDAIREIGTSSGLITLVEGQIPDSPAAGHCC
jgi:DNA-binding beta-propeller fold protein YncE